MDLDEMRAFLAVARAGSLAGAARDEGLSRSAIRRRVRALEERLHLTLFDDDGALTGHGERLAERGVELLTLADDVYRDVRQEKATEEVVLHALCPPGTHALAIAAVTGFVRQHLPGVRFVLRSVEDPIDALGKGADLAVYWGEELPPGPWIARRFGTAPWRLLASRPYLKLHGQPASLDELPRHAMLIARWDGRLHARLPLIEGGSVAVDFADVTNDPHLAVTHARAGLGLGFGPAPEFPTDPWPGGGAVPVLPEVVGRDVPVWLVAAGAMSSRPSVAAVVESLGGFMQQQSRDRGP